MSKARITYRFERDHAEPEVIHAEPITRREEPVPGNVIPLYQEDIDAEIPRYGQWKSVFDEETERIERMIREAKPARQVEEEQENDWVPVYEEIPTRTLYRNVRRQKSWFGAASAAAGAILTGVALGLFVLSLFNGSDDPNITGKDQASLPGTQMNTDTIMPEGDLRLPDMELSDVSTVAVELAEKTYYFVQNGVFSSSEGAMAAAAALKDRGLAGVVDDGEKLAVFAGVAENNDDALLIGHQLQDAGLEVYIKPYVLPAVDQLEWPAEGADSLRSYMESSRELISELLTIIYGQLPLLSPGALPEEQWKQLKAEHQSWTMLSNQVTALTPESLKDDIAAMNTAMMSAVAAIEQYNKKPTDTYLWQAQSGVTEHIIHQYKMLNQAAHP